MQKKPEVLRQLIGNKITELGFDSWGVTSVPVELRRDYYLNWIAEGQQGAMDWMERNNDKRLHPEKIIDGAQSIICVGLNYFQDEPRTRARIAKYALGRDYHKVINNRLKILCSYLRGIGGEQRNYVDTGPLLEKPIAQLAGLGFQGKSTILINRDFGTWLFLGVVITTLNIAPDLPIKRDYCGKCTACIDVCPTKAITAPFQLDARKCIAYLTIEHKESIPVEYRHAIGDRVFGCDECLDVCPWNRFAKITREADFKRRDFPDLRKTLDWTESDFLQQFNGTPIMRLKLNRWLRNACVVLGNIGDKDDLEAIQGLLVHNDSMVAEHAQWAIEQIKKRERVI